MSVAQESSCGLEFSSLHIPANVIEDIQKIVDAVMAIDPTEIFHHGQEYARASTILSAVEKSLRSGQKSLTAAWSDSDTSVVNLPQDYDHTVVMHSSNTAQFSDRCTHISHIAQLTQQHCEQQISSLRDILRNLADAVVLAQEPEDRQRIRQQAYTAAVSTHQTLEKITRVYRDSLQCNENVLGMDINHLPPLWGDCGMPRPEDINQGALGDNDFHTTIGEMAFVNPEFIKNGIKEDPEHSGNYIVTLYRKRGNVLTTQTISADELRKSLVHGKYDKFGGQQALWPYIAEAAYAKYRGGSVRHGERIINNGGYLDETMTACTGKKSDLIASDPRLRNVAYIKDPQYIVDQISAALHDNRPVTAGVFNLYKEYGDIESNGHSILRDNSYMILGVKGNQLLIRSPFGDSHNEGENMWVNAIDLLRNQTEFAISR